MVASCTNAIWRGVRWLGGGLIRQARALLVWLGTLCASCIRAVRRGSWWLISGFLRQVLPYFFCVWLEWWRLGRRIAQEEATPALNADMEQYMSIDIAAIEAAHQLELSRREQLRKNAQANLAAVTVALTFIFGVFGVVSNQYLEPPSERLGWLVRAIGAFGVVSLLMAAMSAVRALAPSRFYDMWLQTHLASAGRMSPEGEKKAKLIKAIFLNQEHTLIIANHSSASSTGMRNGVVAIGITLLLIIVSYSRTTPATSLCGPILPRNGVSSLRTRHTFRGGGLEKPTEVLTPFFKGLRSPFSPTAAPSHGPSVWRIKDA